MAIEKIEMKVNYMGTAAELAAITVKTKYHPGDTFYCWDTKANHIFANGDWRLA